MKQKILDFIKNRKWTSLFIAIVIIIVGYYGYKSFVGNTTTISYVLSPVEKGTLITSISGSGQVSVVNQIDLKAKNSGEVYSVPVKAGQEVKAGTVLMALNAVDAARAVRDAKLNLESAQISMEKLKQPADSISFLQAQNALDQANDSKKNAEDDLKKAYDDGFSNVSNTFLDLPDLMDGLYGTLFSTSGSQQNLDFFAYGVAAYDEKEGETALKYRDDALNAYNKAKTAYDTSFSDFKTATRYSDAAALEALVKETYDTTKLIGEAVKESTNLIQFYKDSLNNRQVRLDAMADTYLSKLAGYTGTINTNLLSLLNITQTIETSRQAITTADRTIAEKTESLAKLNSGADALDIQSQEISLRQKENSLADAEEKLADYYVAAPFDGIVATIDVKKGDQISSGAIISTFITKQRTAILSFNEVDAAKIAVGQKATLTFDAVDGLSLTGEVGEIDTLGTVSQGVVSYNVKIIFDTQDDRVKPGMSVNAAIITEAKPDVLMVPNGAIKTDGDISYVEMFTQTMPDDPTGKGVVSITPPTQVQVEVGISNDTSTEIISGLKEGDKIVTKTTNSSTVKAATPTSLFGGGGSTRNGMGSAMPH
jgi:RND family efflux transporter MFP subunit